MKIKFFFLLLLGATLTLFACKDDDGNPDPVACFNITDNTVASGETASFTSCSEDAHHYEWDFGDGATSPIENPTHIYNNPGTFTVRLDVFNEDMSKTDVETKTITVN